MKTAVEWLVEELCYVTNSGRYIIDNTDDVTDVVNQAIEMEKKQIVKAVYYNVSPMSHDDLPSGESYYNKTFKQQEQ
jgi:aminopeptidase-like protein